MIDNDLQEGLTPESLNGQESAQNQGTDTAEDSSPTDACSVAPSPSGSKSGPPINNRNALRTGKRADRNRLVDCTFPKAAKHAAGKRDVWHRLARKALQQLTGKTLTFAQVDALRDAARWEAVALLAEHRRRQAGLTFEQLAGLDSTITTAIAAKGKILQRLGMGADAEAKSSADPWASLSLATEGPADAP